MDRIVNNLWAELRPFGEGIDGGEGFLLKPTLLLSNHDFDSEHDQLGNGITWLQRGGRDYHQPNNEWHGIGLNIKGKFQDDEWLGEGENSWAAAYFAMCKYQPEIEAEIANMIHEFRP